jgi:hypothetical protein
MMSQNEAKISKLRCEPYYADNSDCSIKEYGMRYPFECVLWHVFIDDIAVSSGTLPFEESDSQIELHANKCLPYFGEGGQFVTARLFEDKVFWFGFDSSYTIGDLLPINTIYVFNAEAYVHAIRQADNIHARLKDFEKSDPNLLQQFLKNVGEYLSPNSLSAVSTPPTNTTIQSPPKLSTKELRDVLLQSFPRDLDLPLYRMPELADDKRGSRLFRAVWEAIKTQELLISQPPQNIVEVHIGLDTKEFMESVWQVGRVGDDIAILFEVEPHFPLWLGGFGTIARWIDVPSP